MALTKGVDPQQSGGTIRVLVVDDEPSFVETIESRFRQEGFTVFSAASAADGMRLVRRVKPDLVLVDAMLPQRSGIEFCRAVRQDHVNPALFLMVNAENLEQLKSLGLEVDEYVVKPLNLAALTSRTRAFAQRLTGEPAREAVESGNLKIDPKTREASLAGKPLVLSPKEFGLLYFLCRHKGQVFSRKELLDRVWGRNAFVSARTVDVHIRWLRMRIEADSNSPTRILTVRGVGYKFLA